MNRSSDPRHYEYEKSPLHIKDPKLSLGALYVSFFAWFLRQGLIDRCGLSFELVQCAQPLPATTQRTGTTTKPLVEPVYLLGFFPGICQCAFLSLTLRIFSI